jgi:hypothetical protein
MSMNNGFLIVNSVMHDLSQFKTRPVLNNPKQEVVTGMDIKSSADLKTQLPEIHNEVFTTGIAAGKADGVKQERERLQSFDALNGKVDPDFLNQEKYKDGATAESVLFAALKAGKLINSAYVAQAEMDAASANQVPGAASPARDADEVKGVLAAVTNIAKNVFHKGGKQ